MPAARQRRQSWRHGTRQRGGGHAPVHAWAGSEGRGIGRGAYRAHGGPPAARRRPWARRRRRRRRRRRSRRRRALLWPPLPQEPLAPDRSKRKAAGRHPTPLARFPGARPRRSAREGRAASRQAPGLAQAGTGGHSKSLPMHPESMPAAVSPLAPAGRCCAVLALRGARQVRRSAAARRMSAHYGILKIAPGSGKVKTPGVHTAHQEVAHAAEQPSVFGAKCHVPIRPFLLARYGQWQARIRKIVLVAHVYSSQISPLLYTTLTLNHILESRSSGMPFPV